MNEGALFLEFSIGMFLWRGSQDKSNGRKCVLKVLRMRSKGLRGIMHHLKGASLVVPLDALLRLMNGGGKGESCRITRLWTSDLCY